MQSIGSVRKRGEGGGGWEILKKIGRGGGGEMRQAEIAVEEEESKRTSESGW